MIRVLASAQNKAEAIILAEAGADIVDLKNPSQGALGALAVAEVKAIVAKVKSANPATTVSATIGDLPMDPTLIRDAVVGMASTGVDIVKIGFFGIAGHQECIDALVPEIDSGIKIIAVMLADQSPNLSLVKALADAKFYGVMLDTANKDGSSLTDHIDEVRLTEFVAEARKHSLFTGLAGSLKPSDISKLAPIKPDYLGFRGALCGKAIRTNEIQPHKVAEIKQLVVSVST